MSEKMTTRGVLEVDLRLVVKHNDKLYNVSNGEFAKTETWRRRIRMMRQRLCLKKDRVNRGPDCEDRRA